MNVRTAPAYCLCILHSYLYDHLSEEVRYTVLITPGCYSIFVWLVVSESVWLVGKPENQEILSVEILLLGTMITRSSAPSTTVLLQYYCSTCFEEVRSTVYYSSGTLQ